MNYVVQQASVFVTVSHLHYSLVFVDNAGGPLAGVYSMDRARKY